jgi:beta-N-acetylhexosaminidase
MFIVAAVVLPAAADSLEKKIGQMLMVGFYGTQAPKDSAICKAIRTYDIGAVILFDVNPVDPKQPKNIRSVAQVKRLTRQLQACSPRHDLLIAVDQEGGRVQRLKSKYGFYGRFPSAADVARLGTHKAKSVYERMARELRDAGINYDLAPVVDLDINPKNHVIHGLKRAFGGDPETVVRYASVFIDAMHRYGILTSLKHFPGHGSSLGDTHKGFVDVTKLWREKELTPYKLLVNKADTVMVAHVFNRKLDSRYPATLSKKTVEGLLRKKIGFDGVVITDDLQMGAIAKTYTLAQTLRLAIEAGNDILLFGNQIDPKRIYTPEHLVKTVVRLVREGKIKKDRIERSYRRIRKLKASLRNDAF